MSRVRAGPGVAAVALLVPILVALAAVAGAADWKVEIFVGVPFGFPASLTIRQSGQPDIHLRARCEARPFRRPIYYGWRVGRWSGGDGWEVEFLHDKLYLADPPPDVQEFAISHGFNLATVNRARERGGIVYRGGAGAVIAHPETTVRGRALSQDGGLLGRGYYLSGPTIQAAVEKRFGVGGDLVVPVEGKATASFARVPVADGSADVARAAVHGMAGLGAGR